MAQTKTVAPSNESKASLASDITTRMYSTLLIHRQSCTQVDWPDSDPGKVFCKPFSDPISGDSESSSLGPSDSSPSSSNATSVLLDVLAVIVSSTCAVVPPELAWAVVRVDDGGTGIAASDLGRVAGIL